MLVKKQSNDNSDKSVIVESSVERIDHWIHSHDCAVITASRKWIYNTTGRELPYVLELAVEFPDGLTDFDKRELVREGVDTKAFDDERKKYLNSVPKLTRNAITKFNNDLEHSLRGFGYGVTRVHGVYTPKGSDSELENSLFVVNLCEDSKFIERLTNLGFDYNQDVVLIKPKNSDDAYLYGTNLDREVGVIPRGNTFISDILNIGYFQKYISAENMTSIRNHCFGFSPTPLPPETPTNFRMRKDLRKQKMSESLIWIQEEEDNRWSSNINRACAYEHESHWKALKSGLRESIPREWVERIRRWKIMM